jgi:hypothetical protein
VALKEASVFSVADAELLFLGFRERPATDTQDLFFSFSFRYFSAIEIFASEVNLYIFSGFGAASILPDITIEIFI